MVAVVVFEFGCMRCQPLRRALCAQWSLRLRSFNVF
ncbi:acetyltransferase [Vibrio cholerae]|nr:acetyltransferase [Vibrio cholerae]